MITTQRFLLDLSGRHARFYFAALQDMAAAIGSGNAPALADARRRMEKAISETMGIAEVLGASLTLKRAASVLAAGRSSFATATAAPQPIMPNVTFDEAVQDMVNRTPTTIRRSAERTAANISKLYGEGRVVAFVKSAEAAVTKRVQTLIAEAMEEGITEVAVGRRIVKNVKEIRKRTALWSEGYARMSFRTNFNTAVTAGKFRQVRDPDIAKVVPALQFATAGDVDVRDNHAAGEGKIMLVTNSAWGRLAPPLGYGCRCDVDYVTLPELRRMGRIGGDGKVREDRPPASWHPDEGFSHGGRPDLFLNELLA